MELKQLISEIENVARDIAYYEKQLKQQGNPM